MPNNLEGLFPISKKSSIKGSRRLAREKVLQILIASSVSDVPADDLFEHIFYREFNFGDDEMPLEPDRVLHPDVVYEIEADRRISWKDDEVEFGKKLIECTQKNEEFTDTLLKEFATNWELDRIAIIDRYLMHIAAAELLFFPEVPPKVSINEVIDIAKKYSTDKSGVFINGVLDSMLAKLKADGKLTKEGRGLVND